MRFPDFFADWFDADLQGRPKAHPECAWHEGVPLSTSVWMVALVIMMAASALF